MTLKVKCRFHRMFCSFVQSINTLRNQLRASSAGNFRDTVSDFWNKSDMDQYNPDIID